MVRHDVPIVGGGRVGLSVANHLAAESELLDTFTPRIESYARK